MNTRLNGKLSFVLALALLFATLAPLPVFATGSPTPVNGWTLGREKTGDCSEWIEIAQYGNYSLILRKDPIQESKFGKNNSYKDSEARKIVNNWFCALPSNARLLKYTVSNNALSQIGNWDSLKNGISVPGASSCYGSDVAFLLSFAEAALYCSNQNAKEHLCYTQYIKSGAVAIANFAKLPALYGGASQRLWWLRSRGDSLLSSSNYVSAVGVNGSDSYCGSNSKDGTVDEFKYNNTCGKVRPALWVDRKIFEVEKYPVTVNYYKDCVSSSNFLGSRALPAAQVGSAITGVDLTAFAPPNYKVPGVISGDTVVKAGGSVVNVVYTRSEFTVNVYYYKDSMLPSNQLGFNTYSAAAGVSVKNVISLTAYAPAGYATPGEVFGDLTVREGVNNTYVVYSKSAYPIKVIYYKDSISGANQLGVAELPAAVVGTAINNVNLSLFAPSGYTVPGTRSGDSVVAARQNIVNVLYTKGSLVYVFYYQDTVGGPYLGAELVTLDLPWGSAISGINLTKYAPPGYEVPGKLYGDTVTKDPMAVVYVVYTKKANTAYKVTIRHKIQLIPGDLTNFYEFRTDVVDRFEGDLIRAEDVSYIISGFKFLEAIPPSLIVGPGSTELIIRYAFITDI